MQLFYKIYLFLIILLMMIVAGAGYIGFQREVKLYNNDMKKDALLLGEALSGMVAHTWENSKPDEALKLIREANSVEHNIKIRWVNLAASAPMMNAPLVPPEKIKQVLHGKTASLIIKKQGGDTYRFTYIPIKVDTCPHCALELSESLSVLKNYTRHSFFHLLFTIVLILLSSGLILWFFFRKWIHQPLVMFTEKSRKIGMGDLAPDLVVKGRDEFAELGRTLNSMCLKLSESQEAVRIENERRIETIEQLRHSERLATLGRLSAGIAHELGTPLNVISGRAKLIRNGDLETHQVIDFARIIEEQATKITKIIRGLLDYVHPRKPNRSLQDMEMMVNRVLEMLAPTANKAKVVLKFINQGVIPQIPVDTIQIQQVLTNLIMNGIQAMENGGNLEIELSTQKRQHPDETDTKKNYLTIHVKDQGPGIPEENIGHLFEPFFTTKDVGSGTGLGLSISYGIIKEHGGWIEVYNQKGHGACFSVFLPIEVTL